MEEDHGEDRTEVDIGLHPTTAPSGPTDVATAADKGPCQPVLVQFPRTQVGKRSRCFQANWYTSYSWLEYSQIANAAFCFACRHFSVRGKTAEAAYTVSGFKNWKKANTKDGFQQHDHSDYHKLAMATWSEYKLMKASGQGTVLQMQSAAYAKQIQDNRHYMKTVAEVLLLTASQNISQLGHHEDEDTAAGEENTGNFLAILQLIAKHDAVVAERIAEGPKNAKYTSKDIQNEVIGIMADLVRDQIVDELKESRYFSIAVDECKDISKKEQISLIVRYYYEHSIKECFLEFKPAVGLDADTLAKSIISSLQVYGLDLSYLVGQASGQGTVHRAQSRMVLQL